VDPKEVHNFIWPLSQ